MGNLLKSKKIGLYQLTSHKDNAYDLVNFIYYHKPKIQFLNNANNN